MRVLIDTNVIISHLLSGQRTPTAVARLFGGLITGDVELVLPRVVEDEVLKKVREKPSLASISVSETLAFLERLRALAVATPHGTVAVVPLARDPDDDVLLAYAVAGGVDYLVTGDKDLLVLADTLAPLKIRSAQAFLEELDDDDPE